MIRSSASSSEGASARIRPTVCSNERYASGELPWGEDSSISMQGCGGFDSRKDCAGRGGGVGRCAPLAGAALRQKLPDDRQGEVPVPCGCASTQEACKFEPEV